MKSSHEKALGNVLKGKNIDGKKIRPTRKGFPNGTKGGIYGGMHLEEAMRHEERRIRKNK